MKHWLVLAGILAAAPALAEGEDVNFIVGLWPGAKSCPAEKTVAVALEAVLANPRAYDNKCITVKGYVSGRAMYVDPDDTMLKYASSNPKAEGHRIGLSARDEIEDRFYGRYNQQYVEVRGKVWMCEDTGPWLGGYCHYTHGPFIGIIDVKAVREPMRYRREWE